MNLQELWAAASRGEFNRLPPQHEPAAFHVGVIALPFSLPPYEYNAKRAYECWLKTGNPALGGR